MGRLAEGRLTLDALQGHWRRDWMRWPGRGGGGEDATTRVHWLQAGALYADIRVPAERPALDGARCLDDLDPPALLGLMQAEGFAGTITLEGDICTWHRRINWHGRPAGVDAGRMHFAGAALIEDGVYAAYRELWQPVAGPALCASRVRGRTAEGPVEGVLVSSDTLFLLALGRPDAKPSAPLLAALATGTRPPEVARHFAGLYALGRWQGAHGIADLATDPFLEGRPVLDRTSGLTLHRTGFAGRAEAVPLEREQSLQDQSAR